MVSRQNVSAMSPSGRKQLAREHAGPRDDLPDYPTTTKGSALRTNERHHASAEPAGAASLHGCSVDGISHGDQAFPRSGFLVALAADRIGSEDIQQLIRRQPPESPAAIFLSCQNNLTIQASNL